jgi:thiaminase (transcriptional activator TenA)
VHDGRFTDELRHAAEPLWQAQFEHPFVRGIAEGTLDEARFRAYLVQDAAFLVDYARTLSYAAARAPDAELSRRFAELAAETWTGELELHRSVLSEPELAAAAPDETTRAYADFLLRLGRSGEFAELAAALLPCMWGYSELGRELARGPIPQEPLYARWIETYADPGFAELADWCRAVVDGLAAGAPAELRERMRAAFLESARHELAFWQASWVRES